MPRAERYLHQIPPAPLLITHNKIGFITISQSPIKNAHAVGQSTAKQAAGPPKTPCGRGADSERPEGQCNRCQGGGGTGLIEGVLTTVVAGV